MLAKKKRLNLRLLDLPLFFKQTKCFRTSCIHAFYRVIKTSNKETCRMAVIVPKKVSLKAVERNRLKRRAYAISCKLFFNEKNIENFKNKISGQQQLQVVCVMKKKALTASQAAMEACFQKLLLAVRFAAK